MNLSTIILAAGQGTRMRSSLPKVLHLLAGKPLVSHVIETALNLNPAAVILVYGHGGESVRETLSEFPISFALQDQQLGTGHAVIQAMDQVNAVGGDFVLVLYGDVPLISAATLRKLIVAKGEQPLALLTMQLPDPKGYGRIVRAENGSILSIIEEKDADESVRSIQEVNTGILVADRLALGRWLSELDNHNSQKEYYLTDIVRLCVASGGQVQSTQTTDVHEVLGVNNKRQLAELERHYQLQQANHLMDAGVTLADPARLDVRGEVKVGKDVFIDANVQLLGSVTLGDRVSIGPNVVIRDTSVADDVEVLAFSLIEEATLATGCSIGPYARIRPGTHLEKNVKIGNFVEIKKSNIAEDSKVNHLSYIGDSEIGKRVNIGAGTITCNYDGTNKHKTMIGDDVFVGSDTQLVAPVKVGAGATIGAGSTITSEVPANELTLSRAKQKTIPGWKRPTKKPKG